VGPRAGLHAVEKSKSLSAEISQLLRKDLGSGKGKHLRCGLCYEERKEVEQEFYCVCSELISILTL
jgi:hypothetical protein